MGLGLGLVIVRPTRNCTIRQTHPPRLSKVSRYAPRCTTAVVIEAMGGLSGAASSSSGAAESVCS